MNCGPSNAGKIVLFEPDRRKRGLHGTILLSQGYKVEWTDSEAEAHLLCEAMRPDLVLVGLCEPLSGIFEMYDRFRCRYPGHKVAFVPGELKLSDLFLDGELIRRTRETDFVADIATFLPCNLALAAQG